MARSMKIGGGENFFALRHKINMAISDGKIDEAIESMTKLSNSKQVNAIYLNTKNRIDEILPLLKSREDTLAFLSTHRSPDADSSSLDNWATEIFWAAYYGDYELAAIMLEKGTLYDDKLGVLDTTWFNYPIISPLHNTDAYKHMIRRIKLDQFWRENGFPSNCRPLGEDDFACN
jgi:hypothetical protein